MRGWLVLGFVASTGACSLIVGTDGLSGVADIDGGPANGDAAGESAVSDATTETCIGSGCVAPPIPPCDGPCLPVRIAKDGLSKGLAADESGVYWTAEELGDVRHAGVDGTGVVSVFDGDKAPRLLALDDTFVYWTESNSGIVSAARKDGNRGPRAMLGGQVDVFGIAVSAGEVFFHVRSTGEVRKSPTDLSTSTLLTTQTTGAVFGLAADGQNVYLGVTAGINRVRRAPRATQTTEPTDLSTKVLDLLGFAIDAARVYLADGDSGSVLSEKIDGSGGLVTHSSGEAMPSSVAVDGTHVYWTNQGNGLIRRVAKAGGTAETLASGQAAPFAIAVNSRAVYWLTTDGSVMTVRKP
jgi:hypothetical protein